MRDPDERPRLTAPCGLYCADCIPSRREFFDLLRSLDVALEQHHIEEYAALKAKTVPALRDYGVFTEVLSALIALECPSPCREGGGKAVCTVRDCVEKRRLDGCWACAGRGSCRTLAPLLAFHPNLAEHLETIREKGEGKWPAHRKAHYQGMRSEEHYTRCVPCS